MSFSINGTFIRYKKRNEKTGASEFVLQKEMTEGGSPYVVIRGILPRYPKGTPITVELRDKLAAPVKTAGEKREDAVKQPLCINSSLYEGSTELSEKFLSSGNFPQIGPEAARAIINVTKGKIFSLSNEETVVSAIKSTVRNIKKEDIESCLRRLKALKRFEDLYKWLREKTKECEALIKTDDYSGIYECATRSFEDHGINAKEIIQENPYVLLNYQAPLCLSEYLAKKAGIEMCDKKRIRAITMNSMICFRNSGNTSVPFHSLYSRIKAKEAKIKDGYKTSALFIAEEVLSDRYVFDDDTLQVSFRDDYLDEKSIADNIMRLEATGTDNQDDMVSIADIESITGNAYSEDQKTVFEALKKNGVKCITGGPGTGKTTLLNGLLTKYRIENSKKSITLCAPTGKAASRMKETTGLPAKTIHSLLGIVPYQSKESLPPVKKLESGLVVVDECSMVDISIMARLLKSLPNDTLLILMGDSDQLESIGAGNVFGDVINSGKVPVYRLTTVHRQDADNPIVKNSKKVMEGDSRLFETADFKIIRAKNEEELSKKASEYAAALYRKKSEARCFVPTKKSKFLSGSIQINASIQNSLVGEDFDCVIYGPYRFAKGSPVIFCRNNYERGYINGQDGVVTDVQKHGETCRVTICSDGEEYNLKDSELADIELSYSITAHKAQGSETEEAVILVPKNPESMLLRRLLYVEITRAKKKVTIFSEGSALEEAISDKREYKRNTMLPKMLAKFC